MVRQLCLRRSGTLGRTIFHVPAVQGRGHTAHCYHYSAHTNWAPEAAKQRSTVADVKKQVSGSPPEVVTERRHTIRVLTPGLCSPRRRLVVRQLLVMLARESVARNAEAAAAAALVSAQ